MPHIHLEEVVHNSLRRIALRFAKNEEIISHLRLNFSDARWSQTNKYWHIEKDNQSVKKLLQVFKGVAFINCSGLSRMAEASVKIVHQPIQLNHEATLKMKQFEQFLTSRRFAESTVKTYLGAMRVFLNFFKETPISELNNQDVIRFNNEYILVRRLSGSYQNQTVNAIKKFFLLIENH